jgi:hypothetical protein
MMMLYSGRCNITLHIVTRHDLIVNGVHHPLSSLAIATHSIMGSASLVVVAAVAMDNTQSQSRCYGDSNLPTHHLRYYYNVYSTRQDFLTSRFSMSASGLHTV